MFDLDAAVGHDLETRVPCALLRLGVRTTELQPEGARTTIENGVHHPRYVLWPAKDVDDVDLDVIGNRCKIRPDLLAEDFLGHGIDGDHLITRLLQISCNTV